MRAGAPPPMELELALTISAGVASSGQVSDPEALLARADEHLYHAKRGGKDQARR
jgi:PleD family two-component response regulator